jgi:lipopolysaccharide transport system ATP-binding protein
LTGRENIYLNGAILGMRRAEINRQFDEIVAFAEVERFIDTPVKHYSSGMYLRLAFAVAAHLEPEILLVDEVLAVGDAQFQKKCLGKMGDVAEEGRTVLFVSHNMAAMRSLCQRGILLEAGQLKRVGSMADCIQDYLSDKTASAGSIVSHLSKPHPHIQIDSITINGQENDEVHLSSDVRSLRIEVQGRLSQPMCLEIEARIYDLYETPLAFFSPGHQYGKTDLHPSGKFHLRREMALPIMMHGQYDLTLYLTHPGKVIWVTIPRAVRLHAEGVRTSIRLHPRNYYQGASWVFLPDVNIESHKRRAK